MQSFRMLGGNSIFGGGLGVQVRGGGVSYLAPDEIANLAMWLQVDSITGKVHGDKVASWPDSSGNNVVVGQTNATYQPLYQVINGKAYVRNVVSGAIDYSSLPSMSNGQSTLFMVGKNTVNPSMGGYPFLFGNYPGAGVVQAGGMVQPHASNITLYASGIAVPQTVDDVMVFRNDYLGSGEGAQGRGASSLVNNRFSFRSMNLGTSGYPTSVTVTAGHIGGIGAATSGYWQGDIREVILYSRPLTQDEIDNVVGYLAVKHDIARANPTRLYVFDGDSLSTSNLGTGLVNTKGYVENVLLGETEVFKAYNTGVSGQTLTQMASDAATQIDPLYDATIARNILVIWGGTNDIWTGVAPATAYSNLVSYCQARRAVGFEVVVCTMLPRGTSTYEANRQTFNTSIRTNWATFADGLADIGADPTIGDDLDQDNTTYYQGDKIHLTMAGYAIVSPIVRAAIDAL